MRRISFPVQMIKQRSISTVVTPFSAEWVTVNIPCNNRVTTYGGVDGSAVKYNFFIDKHELAESSIAEYNADPINSTRQITIDSRGDNKPATSLTWNEAARFVNWLNIREGEQPAYNFTTSSVNDNISLWSSASAWQTGRENLYRHVNAKYFIPTEDEWYKAAYYDPDERIYYSYPTGSNSPPVDVLSGSAVNTAVYDGLNVQPTEPADRTQSGGTSPFGTMGQGGNVTEWVESAFDKSSDTGSEARVGMGGNWTSPLGQLAGSVRASLSPTTESTTTGMRVAYAPVGTGSSSPDQLLSFVPIGDAGNAAYNTLSAYVTWPIPINDCDGSGSVAYDFEMGTYAIKVCDIDEYNRDSINSTRQIAVGNSAGYNSNPAIDISWNEAARFVNWLNIKAGEQPAYNFTTSGVNDNITLWSSASAWQNGGENLFRHKDARYFLPSEDEYIKAGFYDGVNDVYYRFPTGSNTQPGPFGGGTDQDKLVYARTSSAPDNGRAPVDFCGGVSPYGTMGQAGNASEWVETTWKRSTNNRTNDDPAENRGFRGGSARVAYNIMTTLMCIDRQEDRVPTQDVGINCGFRVARAPVGTGSAP